MSSTQGHPALGIFAILLASILWGTTGTAASFNTAVSPLATGAFAMGFAGLLLVLTALPQLRNDASAMLKQPRVMLLGALAVAVYPLAFYTSMHLAGVAIGTVVSIACAPFFAAVLECLISKKFISKKWLLSFAFGAVGIVLLTLGKVPTAESSIAADSPAVGVLLGLLAAFTYATYSWSAKRMIQRGVHSKSAMAAMFGLAAVVLLPSLWLTGDNLFSGATNTSVALYMALVPMFIGYLLFGYGLKQVDASTATLITLLEPAVATLMAIWVVGEVFQPIGWWGMGFILICLMLETFKFRLPKALSPVTS